MAHLIKKLGEYDKVVKVLGGIVAVIFFVLTIRDRLEAVPVLQKDVKTIKRRLSRQDQQMAYLVGAMQAQTGRPFRPSVIKDDDE